MPPALTGSFGSWARQFGFKGWEYVLVDADMRVDRLLSRLPWDTASLGTRCSMPFIWHEAGSPLDDSQGW
jgi:hypothetical protein